MHTHKSVVVVDSRKYIHVLTPIYNGKTHDKKILEESGILENIPEDIEIIADSGFQGIQHQTSSTVHIPIKKSKNKPLHPKERDYNRQLSSIRVINEHAIGSLKRNKCLSDTLRHSIDLDDKFFLITAGLHNLSL
jgi:hypothetical protein